MSALENPMPEPLGVQDARYELGCRKCYAKALREAAPLRTALESIAQRANEHSPGFSREAQYLETIHAMHEIARNALSAIPAAGDSGEGWRVPDGWKLVPLVPTEEMTTAVARRVSPRGLDTFYGDQMAKVYRAMIGTAPPPPASGTQESDYTPEEIAAFREQAKQANAACQRALDDLGILPDPDFAPASGTQEVGKS